MTRIGQYRLLDRIGEGGMGAVFRGEDTMLQRQVAIKVLRPELARQQALVERFRTEAVALARLNHPNIATVYGLLQQDGQYYMVLEFVDGQTLEAILARRGRLPWSEAVGLARDTLAALDHAHGMGVVHRDLKPANLMVTRSGQLKVMDFGIARLAGTSRHTEYGRIVGTPLYMSPEQLRGEEVDGRSDVYSLGVVLYELLTGREAFQADSDYALLMAQLNQMPEPVSRYVPDLPADLEAVLDRALSKSRNDRWRSAADFRRALARIAPDRAVRPTGEIPIPPAAATPAVAASESRPPAAAPATRLGEDPTPPSQPADDSIAPGRLANASTPRSQPAEAPTSPIRLVNDATPPTRLVDDPTPPTRLVDGPTPPTRVAADAAPPTRVADGVVAGSAIARTKPWQMAVGGATLAVLATMIWFATQPEPPVVPTPTPTPVAPTPAPVPPPAPVSTPTGPAVIADRPVTRTAEPPASAPVNYGVVAEPGAPKKKPSAPPSTPPAAPQPEPSPPAATPAPVSTEPAVSESVDLSAAGPALKAGLGQIGGWLKGRDREQIERTFAGSDADRDALLKLLGQFPVEIEKDAIAATNPAGAGRAVAEFTATLKWRSSFGNTRKIPVRIAATYAADGSTWRLRSWKFIGSPDFD